MGGARLVAFLVDVVLVASLASACGGGGGGQTYGYSPQQPCDPGSFQIDSSHRSPHAAGNAPGSAVIEERPLEEWRRQEILESFDRAGTVNKITEKYLDLSLAGVAFFEMPDYLISRDGVVHEVGNPNPLTFVVQAAGYSEIPGAEPTSEQMALAAQMACRAHLVYGLPSDKFLVPDRSLAGGVLAAVSGGVPAQAVMVAPQSVQPAWPPAAQGVPQQLVAASANGYFPAVASPAGGRAVVTYFSENHIDVAPSSQYDENPYYVVAPAGDWTVLGTYLDPLTGLNLPGIYDGGDCNWYVDGAAGCSDDIEGFYGNVPVNKYNSTVNRLVLQGRDPQGNDVILTFFHIGHDSIPDWVVPGYVTKGGEILAEMGNQGWSYSSSDGLLKDAQDDPARYHNLYGRHLHMELWTPAGGKADALFLRNALP